MLMKTIKLKERLNHNNDKMNTTIDILIIVIKNAFFIFVPFLILSLCHDGVSLCNDRNLSKDFSISF